MTTFVALAALSGGVMYLATWAGDLDPNVWEKMPYNFLVRLFSGTIGSSSVIGAGDGANDKGNKGRQPDDATQQRCFPLSNGRSHLRRRIANLRVKGEKEKARKLRLAERKARVEDKRASHSNAMLASVGEEGVIASSRP
jgi:hypothetical protein